MPNRQPDLDRRLPIASGQILDRARRRFQRFRIRRLFQNAQVIVDDVRLPEQRRTPIRIADVVGITAERVVLRPFLRFRRFYLRLRTVRRRFRPFGRRQRLLVEIRIDDLLTSIKNSIQFYSTGYFELNPGYEKR